MVNRIVTEIQEAYEQLDEARKVRLAEYVQRLLDEQLADKNHDSKRRTP